jgi:PST family polysaccharide transporter
MEPEVPVTPPPLDNRIALGGPVTMVAQVGKLAVRVASTVVLARLLTPADYGVFGMAVVIYGLFMVGRELGLTAAGIQKVNLSSDEASALFWLQVASGFILAVLLAVAGFPAAAFYGEPVLRPVMAVMAIGLVCSSFGLQFRVQLVREMRYPAIATIEVTALLVSSLLGIGAAAAGLGYWSLVVVQVGLEALMAVGFWLWSNWRPGAWPSKPELRWLIRFAAGVTGFNYSNYLSSFCDQFLIGRWFGSVALGLYGRAWQLAMLPASTMLGPLTGWMMHALSRLRDHPDEFRHLYRTVVGGFAHLCCPLAALLAVAPEQCLRVFLGPQWTAAAPLLRLLALGVFLEPLAFADVWVLLGIAHSRRLFVWSSIKAALLLVALLVARVEGLQAAAAAVALVAIVTQIAGIRIVSAVSCITPGDVVRAFWRPTVMAVSAGALLAAAKGWLPSDPGLITGFVVLYAAVVLCWADARAEAFAFLRLIRNQNRPNIMIPAIAGGSAGGGARR